MVNELTIPRGTNAPILIPFTNSDGSPYPLTSDVTDIRWLLKLNPADEDGQAVLSKTLLNGGITITNGSAGLATINLAPADTDESNTAIPGALRLLLYWGVKVYLSGGVTYDLLSGDLGTALLQQGGVVAGV
jgi:hypothetical protein